MILLWETITGLWKPIKQASIILIPRTNVLKHAFKIKISLTNFIILFLTHCILNKIKRIFFLKLFWNYLLEACFNVLQKKKKKKTVIFFYLKKCDILDIFYSGCFYANLFIMSKLLISFFKNIFYILKDFLALSLENFKRHATFCNRCKWDLSV